MELMVYLLILSLCLEAILYVPFVWKSQFLRLFFAYVIIFLTVTACAAFFGLASAIVASALTFVGIYRVINMLRIIEQRMNVAYMLQATRRTSFFLNSTGIIVGIIWYFQLLQNIDTMMVLASVVVFQLLVGIIVLLSSVRRLRRTKSVEVASSYANSKLPTVTIAIPARNETDDLQQCLKSLIHSNYPKLEILVLDDCSQLRKTPEIIRGFAHDGVRFIKGEPPAENWLAKNQAYDKLLREASGEIVIFCGVDIRFKSDTVTQVITTLLERNKRMMSILPLRIEFMRVSFSLIQAARYMWELAPPRRFLERPPVLSSCWVAYRKDMLDVGGFKAVSRTILPELFFAKHAAKTDGYSFIRAGGSIQLHSSKSHRAQRDTGVRVRYPQLRRRPEVVLFFTVAMLSTFVAPYILLAQFILQDGAVWVIVALLVGIISNFLSYILVTNATRVMSWFIAPFAFIPTVLADVVLMHYSFLKYEFSEVIWKGRNICVPVMHVIPKLPKSK